MPISAGALQPLYACAYDGEDIDVKRVNPVFFTPRPGVLLAFCGAEHRASYDEFQRQQPVRVQDMPPGEQGAPTPYDAGQREGFRRALEGERPWFRIPGNPDAVYKGTNIDTTAPQHPMFEDPEHGWMCLRHGGCEPARALRAWVAGEEPPSLEGVDFGYEGTAGTWAPAGPQHATVYDGALRSDQEAPHTRGMSNQVGTDGYTMAETAERLREQEMAELAWMLCRDFLGMDEEVPPEVVVPYHAQAYLFLQALDLMHNRGAKYGQGYQAAGWLGSLVDVKRKFERLWHIGFREWRWPLDDVRPPHEDAEFRDAYAALDDNALDLLNHAGFFLQCLHTNNHTGR
jgi:hypothetical protein